jgi:hypothetical protein
MSLFIQDDKLLIDTNKLALDANCCCEDCECSDLEACLVCSAGTCTRDIEVEFAGITNGSACAVGCLSLNATYILSVSWSAGACSFHIGPVSSGKLPCFTGFNINITISPCALIPQLSVSYGLHTYSLSGVGVFDAIDNLCSGLDVVLVATPPTTGFCNTTAATATIRLL